MTRINLFRVAANVVTLGFGHRATLWVQGCDIGCPGCCSEETWDESRGHRVDVDSVLDWIAALDRQPDGLTISGGEPTAQPAAVLRLIEGFRALRPEGDVLLFTGLRYEVAWRVAAELIDNCDVVCAGPYVRSLPRLPLRGSSNQTLHLQTDLARRRYADVDRWTIRNQAVVGPEGFLTVGIPNVEKLKRIGALQGRGGHP